MNSNTVEKNHHEKMYVHNITEGCMVQWFIISLCDVVNSAHSQSQKNGLEAYCIYLHTFGKKREIGFCMQYLQMHMDRILFILLSHGVA